jgi:hypothetical protein
MQSQRWRWLWIWFGFLVAGCGQFWPSEGTPPPDPDPTLPLWGYTLLPPTAWPLHTATPRLSLDTPPSVAFYLVATGSSCYETSVGSLVCLGKIYNPLDIPVEQVTVMVQLLSDSGETLASGETVLAREVIPAHASGPYRVLFEHVPERYAQSTVYIKSGEVAQNAENRYVELALWQVSGTFVLDQYQASLSLVNKSSYAVDQVVITMILVDRYGQVTGFKEVALGSDRQLLPGESLAMTIKVIPQGENTVGFEAFAEGQPIEN